MAGIGEERPLAPDAGFDPFQHCVQGLAEPPDLVMSRRDRQALAEVALRNDACPDAHPFHRSERRCSDEVSEQRGEDERDRSADEELLAQTGKGLVALSERRPDDHDEVLLLSVDHCREQADRIAAVTSPWHEEVSATRAPKLSRVEQRRGAEAGRFVEDTAATVQHLRNTALGAAGR